MQKNKWQILLVNYLILSTGILLLPLVGLALGFVAFWLVVADLITFTYKRKWHPNLTMYKVFRSGEKYFWDLF